MTDCECVIEPKEDAKWDSAQDYVLHLKHLAAYAFAVKHTKGKKVLEVGCGAGYGTYLLSRHALSVIGVDNSAETIEYANGKYLRGNLSFMHYDGSTLPFEDLSFDVIISFQVIEHIPPTALLSFLSEIKRVLKTGGLFLSSTPNRKLRLLPFQRPWNIQHYREYSAKGFKKILGRVFNTVDVMGLYGSEKVQYVEIERVKQNILHVYMKRPMIKAIKYLLPEHVINWIRKAKDSYKVPINVDAGKRDPHGHDSYGQIDLEKYRLNDFKIDASRMSRSLDIIGICTKS